MQNLKKAFANIIGLTDEDMILDDTSYLIPAKGSVLVPGPKAPIGFKELMDRLSESRKCSQRIKKGFFLTSVI